MSFSLLLGSGLTVRLGSALTFQQFLTRFSYDGIRTVQLVAFGSAV